MSKCKKFRKMFDEALCQELTADQKIIFDHHLWECEACKNQYSKMKGMVDFIQQKEENEPEPDFFNNYWKNLSNRLERENALNQKIGKQPEKSKPFFNPKWIIQPAAAILLIVIGVFIGHQLFYPDESNNLNNYNRNLPSNAQSDDKLIQVTENYIQSSKLILLAIVNYDPKNEEPYALNLPLQQKISRSLVRQAAYIKGELKNPKQRVLLELIQDLELILMQIANFEAESDNAAIELIKDGVQKRGILCKINLSDLRKSKNIKKPNII